MSDPERLPGLVQQIRDLAARVEALPRTKRVPQYTTARRPAAADMEGEIIYNTTDSKHQGSDGATWSNMY